MEPFLICLHFRSFRWILILKSDIVFFSSTAIIKHDQNKMSASSEMQIRGSTGSRPVGSSNSPSPLSSTGTSSSPSVPDKRKADSLLYSDIAVRLNENSLEQCRTSVSALSGCVAGIIGLTSYKGFLFYGFSMLLLSVIIFVFIRREHRKFFTGLNHVFVNGFFNGLLTYVLFWTFLYGMVHVY